MAEGELIDLNSFKAFIPGRDNTCGINIRLTRGDLAEQGVDGYVVPHFSTRASEWDVAKAITDKFGEGNSTAYTAYLNSKGGQINFSALVCVRDPVTEKIFFNVATVKSGATEAYLVISQAILNVLRYMDAREISNVGMPALGTGLDGELTNVQSANMMFSTVQQFAEQCLRPDHKLNLTIAFWKHDAVEKFFTFRQVLESGSYKNAHPQPGLRRPDPALIAREMREKAMADVAVVEDGRIIVDMQPSAKVLAFPRRPQNGAADNPELQP